LGILRIEFAPIGEQGAVGETDREEDQEGRAEDRTKAQSFSRDCNDQMFECPGKSESDGEGNGKNQLEETVDLPFLNCSFDRFSDPEGSPPLFQVRSAFLAEVSAFLGGQLNRPAQGHAVATPHLAHPLVQGGPAHLSLASAISHYSLVPGTSGSGPAVRGEQGP